ncbi:hypothetical protein CAPTEDRAFT_185524 [Capitella teleta]|uniref:MULE transposase domain-containing protein n=1 Tax=Capitella teleta TaxID=283909 RepID=R7TZC7_CAPTE|nr:hypothetical protein CAPTEDRAFT_185524 [Capitella teleta]|eukprot:ELT96280.1 hypothetical protein CAPTEDRAFT_185524 [Capitella teleta]
MIFFLLTNSFLLAMSIWSVPCASLCHYFRCKNLHLPEYPTKLVIRSKHNHPLEAADALKYRDVDDSVNERLLTLFREGHSPASALSSLKFDLQLQHGCDYAYIAADRKHCPDKFFLLQVGCVCEVHVVANNQALISLHFRLFKEAFKKEYGELSPTELTKEVLQSVERLNGEGVIRIKAEQSQQTNGALVIVFLTPLMLRVHKKLKHSGELCFMDATGTMDRFNHRVFLLMTHSPAGGLPLGCIVTSSPEVFLTDDSRAERQALSSAFPDSTLLLCVFHVLQAFWRYVWDSKHSIQKDDRPYLFGLMKTMVFCETERAIVFLASDNASFVTGALMPIDGGKTLTSKAARDDAPTAKK